MLTEYSGILKKGDLIAVAQHNHLDIGFYLGRGKNGTVQFYGLKGLIWWSNQVKVPRMVGYETMNPYKWYINSPHKDRIVRISEESLEGEWLELYKEAYEILKSLNI